MLSFKCQVMLLPSELVLVAEVVEVAEAPREMRKSGFATKESQRFVLQVLMVEQQLEARLLCEFGIPSIQCWWQSVFSSADKKISCAY